MLEALEAIGGETIVASGAAEANALGLTAQVPTREVYLTSGPSRWLKLGNQEVEIRHAARWQLMVGKRPAGQALRALSWLGPERAPQALLQLQGRLSRQEWEAFDAAHKHRPALMDGGKEKGD